MGLFSAIFVSDKEEIYLSHYYTNDDTPHAYQRITHNFRGKNYVFKTDRGVFSKDAVDYGSNVLIETVLDTVDEPSDFIDMGSGYGAISVILADQFKTKPLMVDVNRDAMDVSLENLDMNQVAGTVMEREKYDSMDVKTDLYITNPPFRVGKKIVMEILSDGFNRLNDDGSFYMVVQKKQGMPSYKKELERLFGNVEIARKEKRYYILKAVKENGI